MGRSIKLWFFLFCVLLWALFTVGFGWAIKSTLLGIDRSGLLGRVAVEVASFPTIAQEALLEIFGYATGDYKDKWISVQQDDTVDYSGFKPVPTASAMEASSLLMRSNKNITKGWRVLTGAFQINGDIENAVLLISPDLKIVRTWILDEVPIGNLEPQPKYRKLVHGMEILRDGSVIFAFDDGMSLQKLDSCGKREWATAGNFNHSVTLDDTGETVWTIINHDIIARVAVKDGAVLRQISMNEVIVNNPMIDILEIRRQHSNDLGRNSRNTDGSRWLGDSYHLNDVDPLPTAIADRFESFKAGDLLVSARSLNLIFVLSPATLKIKWWRIGAVQRQHDPDWLARGKIMVLNNRMGRDFSQIVAIDPHTFDEAVMLDGRKYKFYTRIRGKVQLLDDGTLLVTSSQQGRAFEVNRDGDVVFEVVNRKPGDAVTNYVISALRWLPSEYFNMDPETWKCPKVH